MVKPPSCLDAAYERRAVEQGLERNPVFPENIEYLNELKNGQKRTTSNSDALREKHKRLSKIRSNY